MENVGRCKIFVIMRDMERKAKQRTPADSHLGLSLYSHKQNKRGHRGKYCVCVHTMKVYRGSRGTAPLILNLVPRLSKRSASRPFYFTLKTHWTTGYVGPTAGLSVLEKRKKKSLAPAWNPALTHPSYSPVPTPSELPQILTTRKATCLLTHQ